ncbi:hypothetical protein [Nostoc sp. C052]|uniref:hypothetical protein n=1 Tax=Nostoc sp. C052 TaxID=2576902 RepID=UPI0015C3FDC0|nr:hypothetical protein [Nostoc sp. C052]
MLFAPFKIVDVLSDGDWVLLERRDNFLRGLPPAWIYCKLSFNPTHSKGDRAQKYHKYNSTI